MACKRIYRKTPYLMGKTMVFSFRLRFSLTWTNPMNFRIWVHVSTVLERCDVWPLELPSGSGGSMEVTEENRAIFEAGAARTWMRCMGLIERVVWPTWWHMDMLWQFQWGKKNPLDHWILMDLGDNKSSRLDQGGEIIQCQWVVGSLRVESLRLQSPKRNRSRLTSSGFFFCEDYSMLFPMFQQREWAKDTIWPASVIMAAWLIRWSRPHPTTIFHGFAADFLCSQWEIHYRGHRIFFFLWGSGSSWERSAGTDKPRPGGSASSLPQSLWKARGPQGPWGRGSSFTWKCIAWRFGSQSFGKRISHTGSWGTWWICGRRNLWRETLDGMNYKHLSSTSLYRHDGYVFLSSWKVGLIH